jgi:hypothetical protein
LPQDRQEIIDDIKKYVTKSKGDYPQWYAGVSSDAPNSLFNVHKVKEKGDRWIYKTAITSKIAREVERYFLIVLGIDGEIGSGEEDSKMVFAYKKAMHTDP